MDSFLTLILSNAQHETLAGLVLLNDVISFVVLKWLPNTFPSLTFYSLRLTLCRGQLKCDGTRAETRFRLSAKRTSPFKSAEGRQFSRLLAAEVCASAVVMLDTTCSMVVRRVLASHSIPQFPLHFPSRASPCAITFQLESTISFKS